MKKILALTLAALLVLSLAGCGRISASVLITNEESDIYKVEEVEAAVQEAMDYFRRNFNGCTLTEIGYAGDEKWKAMEEWADQYNADEAIVLVSTIETNSRGGDGSLAANETYRNYQWILVRDIGGAWEHKTHGYG